MYVSMLSLHSYIITTYSYSFKYTEMGIMIFSFTISHYRDPQGGYTIISRVILICYIALTNYMNKIIMTWIILTKKQKLD